MNEFIKGFLWIALKNTTKALLIIAVVVGILFFVFGYCRAGTIPFVPSYNWYHGCGPTALASIFGYYDNSGYPDLFEAKSWDEIRLTYMVQDEISSPAHNYKYDGMDILSAPDSHTSIADFFETSVDPLGYGESWSGLADNAVRGCAGSRGYEFDSWQKHFCIMDVIEIINEIDQGRPMLALVDCIGNGSPDHFVPIIGYEYRDDLLYYASYNTWHEREVIDWYLLRGVEPGSPFGVERITFIEPISPIGNQNVPIPGTIWLLLSGGMLVGRMAVRVF
ncbi:MAG: hypothetical protein SV375_21740 [Thermodesulfobacteriota bacterium]|nr:hypothetical protein [Thermodesulfobacteriota bacterium]